VLSTDHTGTTDAIFLEKPRLYDLLIDLTHSSTNRPHRPALSISKSYEVNGKTVYKLQTVRFTWSDVKLWTELERILEADVDLTKHTHVLPSGVPSRWADPWRLYEDICMVCAGIWVGWKPPGFLKLTDSDQASNAQSPSAHPLEERASGAQAQSTDLQPSNRPSIDPRLGRFPTKPSTRARVTVLSLLSTFHNHTEFLLAKFNQVMAKKEVERTNEGSSAPVILTPRDVMALELGPGSELDARFIEWLGEINSRSIKVKRGWKDVISYAFGLP
jgi:hypothetical protein